jgi:hypothetical protein
VVRRLEEDTDTIGRWLEQWCELNSLVPETMGNPFMGLGKIHCFILLFKAFSVATIPGEVGIGSLSS